MENLESIEINVSVKKPVAKPQSSNTEVAEKKARTEQGGQAENIHNNFKIDNQGIEGEQQSTKPETPGIDELMGKVQQYVSNFNTKLSFSYDKEENRPIIYVIDKESNEVIRQIPPEQMFKLIKNMKEIRGIIFQEQV